MSSGKKQSGNLRGNCYVTTEALYHLLGGKRSGWLPRVMRTATDTHWFLYHRRTGQILDATVRQFSRGGKPDYARGRTCGFLTKRPSKRAKELMEKMLWNERQPCVQ